MDITKRNHYNPCFWTAHWNPAYLERAMLGTAGELRARDQRVFALNIKSGRIYETVVNNVHYDKDIGIAEITPEKARDFCKRNFPEQYEQFCQDMDSRPETVYMDFEDILSGMETTQAYTELSKVIVEKQIETPMGKGYLAGFIVLHLLRGHSMMNSMVEFTKQAGIEKFEYFWMLKHLLGNTEYLFSLVLSFAPFHWHCYRLERDTFPLNDSPVLTQADSVMVALSPRLMLEIDRTKIDSETSISYSAFICPEKLDEFKRRTIANTFREIIFGEESLLERWRESEEFAARTELMANRTSYNAMVAKHGERELWHLNAFANLNLHPKGDAKSGG